MGVLRWRDLPGSRMSSSGSAAAAASTTQHSNNNNNQQQQYHHNQHNNNHNNINNNNNNHREVSSEKVSNCVCFALRVCENVFGVCVNVWVVLWRYIFIN